jgi:hypothetical protein
MQTLESAIDEFRTLLDSAPLAHFTETDAAAHVSQTGARWTRKQVLGHLLDSAANNHHRFVRAQIEPDFSMPGYAQEAWVEKQHFNNRSWRDLLAFWTSYNRHLLFLMETVTESGRRRLCRVGPDEPVTLEFLMVDYVRHLQHHLAGMVRI